MTTCSGHEIEFQVNWMGYFGQKSAIVHS